jgi:Tol biopolymer transport system component
MSAVFVASANGSHPRRITAWGEWSTSAHWSPDGTRIVFDKFVPGSSGSHNLYLVHPNGTGLKAISPTSLGGVCCAVWSPDGKRLLFRAASHRLLTVNRDGSGVKYLTTGDPSDEAEYAWGR